MSKISAFILLAQIACPAWLLGQRGDIHINYAVAANFYHLQSVQEFQEYQPKVGLGIGTELEYNVNRISSISAGLAVDYRAYDRSYNLSISDPVFSKKDEIRVYYLENVICYNTNFIRRNDLNAFFNLGFVSSTFLKSTSTVENQEFKRFVPGLLLGLGLNFEVGRDWNIVINPRMQYYLKEFDAFMESGPIKISALAGLEYEF